MVSRNNTYAKNIYRLALLAWFVFVSLVMGIGIANDVKEARQHFYVESSNILQQLNETLSLNEAVLDGFSAMMSTVSEDHYRLIRSYARQIHALYPQIYMFEIVDQVEGTHIDAYMKYKQTEDPKFSIRAFSYEGKREWSKAGKQDIYLPIVFMEPFPPDVRNIIGLDLHSNEIFRQAINHAVKTAKPATTVPFKLIEGFKAYLLLRPIREQHVRHMAKGINSHYAILVIRVDSLVAAVGDDKPGYEIKLSDTRFEAGDKAGYFYHYKGRDRSSFEKLLFPQLEFQHKVSSEVQPMHLTRVQQMGWMDINWWLVMIVGSVGVMSFWVLMFYARQFHQNEMKQLEMSDRWFYLANHDSLTELANINLFDDRLQHALAQARRKQDKLAVLFMDLDDFKLINDRHGHDIGDKVLRRVAERLRACLREEDTLSRRSGDEFLVLIENIQADDEVRFVIDKIRESMHNSFVIDAVTMEIGVSIGVVMYPDDADTADELLRQADQAMYKDKDRRKDKQRDKIKLVKE